jgi:hypothetical protein
MEHLRTLPPPSSVIADLLKLGWTWRRRTRRPLLQTFYLVVLAAWFTAATIAASIFSSLVVDSSSLIVLVDSPQCSWITSDAITSYMPAVMTAASNQMRQCYRDREAIEPMDPAPDACQEDLRANITSDGRKAACPFNSSVCEQGATVSMDTGLLDLNDAYGSDLPENDRVQFRKMTTCAPLSLDGYTVVIAWNDTFWSLSRDQSTPSEEVAAMFYSQKHGVSTTNNRTQTTGTLSLIQSNITYDLTTG